MQLLHVFPFIFYSSQPSEMGLEKIRETTHQLSLAFDDISMTLCFCQSPIKVAASWKVYLSLLYLKVGNTREGTYSENITGEVEAFKGVPRCHYLSEGGGGFCKIQIIKRTEIALGNKAIEHI